VWFCGNEPVGIACICRTDSPTQPADVVQESGDYSRDAMNDSSSGFCGLTGVTGNEYHTGKPDG